MHAFNSDPFLKEVLGSKQAVTEAVSLSKKWHKNVRAQDYIQFLMLKSKPGSLAQSVEHLVENYKHFYRHWEKL